METFTTYNQILIFEEQLCQLCMSPQAQINSAATIQQKLGIGKWHSKNDAATPPPLSRGQVGIMRPANYWYMAVRAKVCQLLESIHGGGEWVGWECTCVCVRLYSIISVKFTTLHKPAISSNPLHKIARTNTTTISDSSSAHTQNSLTGKMTRNPPVNSG